jgi:hypothetical protein
MARLMFLTNLGTHVETTLHRKVYKFFYGIKYIFGLVARSYSVQVLS